MRMSQPSTTRAVWVRSSPCRSLAAFSHGYLWCSIRRECDLECDTQKLYLAHGAQEFLPCYCYLDFVTHRVSSFPPTPLQGPSGYCRREYRP